MPFFSFYFFLYALKIACTWNVCIVRFELNRWQAPSICYAIKQSIASYCRLSIVHDAYNAKWNDDKRHIAHKLEQILQVKVCQTLQYATPTMLFQCLPSFNSVYERKKNRFLSIKLRSHTNIVHPCAPVCLFCFSSLLDSRLCYSIIFSFCLYTFT